MIFTCVFTGTSHYTVIVRQNGKVTCFCVGMPAWLTKARPYDRLGVPTLWT